MKRSRLEIARDIIAECPKCLTYLGFAGGRAIMYRTVRDTVRLLIREGYLRERPATPSDGYTGKVRVIIEATEKGIEYVKSLDKYLQNMRNKND